MKKININALQTALLSEDVLKSHKKQTEKKGEGNLPYRWKLCSDLRLISFIILLVYSATEAIQQVARKVEVISMKILIVIDTFFMINRI